MSDLMASELIASGYQAAIAISGEFSGGFSLEDAGCISFCCGGIGSLSCGCLTGVCGCKTGFVV